MPPPLSPRPFSSQVLFFQKLLLNPSVFIKMSLSQLLRRHSFSIHSGYSEALFMHVKICSNASTEIFILCAQTATTHTNNHIEFPSAEEIVLKREEF
uniref:Uncharacterized protein LOC104226244 isoform X5 n=1 Tax=Nicotiana sylvestris TaxID=4096 RepID=A0A1U7W919_NICSY|nr:PREDICTED: uncharacterized protein LOC104226244 isoform X5 [Nicotiana sylvestris]